MDRETRETRETPRNALLTGECRDLLRRLPADSVDAVVTDPPYGLGEVRDLPALLSAWLRGDDGRAHASAAGFMGETWDALCPGPDVWREVYRVVKPGGYVLAFAGTRTWDLMSLAIRLAGFEDRDTIATQFGPVSALSWLQGQGYPKSLNVSAAIDRAEPGAGAGWEGWGTALKPSHEPILVFRKPLAERNVAAQVLATGTGALNIDGGRIGDEARVNDRARNKPGRFAYNMAVVGMPEDAEPRARLGRWPSNVVLVHSPECRPVGTRSVKSDRTPKGTRRSESSWFAPDRETAVVKYCDADGTETIPAWECAPGCPVAALDAQSGTRTSGYMAPEQRRRATSGGGGYQGGFPDAVTVSGTYGDTGGASRFFATFQPDQPDADDAAPFRYVAKAARSEREAGCEDLPLARSEYAPGDDISESTLQNRLHGSRPARNHHRTVKPLALMRWLVRLVCPPGGVVVDPFAGSATTGVACVWEGLDYLLMEQRADYAAIGDARLAHAHRTVAATFPAALPLPLRPSLVAPVAGPPAERGAATPGSANAKRRRRAEPPAEQLALFG